MVSEPPRPIYRWITKSIFRRRPIISHMPQITGKNLRHIAWLTTVLIAFCVSTTGCNQHRYRPADWEARKSSFNTLPTNSSSTTLPQHGSTLPGHGSTLPHGTTLPSSGSTLPRGISSGTTLPGQLPPMNQSTLPR